jgi:hypothetical protein
MKPALTFVGLLALVAAIYMYIKKGNPRMTELENYWWIPLPIALICFIVVGNSRKK